VLRRVHAGQASKRRPDLQRSLQRTVALREIARAAPRLTPADMELAWRAGSGLGVDPEEISEAADALERLFESFAETHAHDVSQARPALARALARLAQAAPPADRPRLAARAVRVDPLLPGHLAAARARRRGESRESRRAARELLASTGVGRDEPVRVAVVSPEPTPYRSPLFDRIAARPEVELTVLYAGRTVAGREWDVEPRHRAVFLPGVRVPGLRRALRHDYPVTPTVFRALGDARPDVVVVNGWSTFPAQAAMAWAHARGVPYLLLVSSHDAVDRPRWRKLLRRPIVPPVVRGAWGAFALGTLSRESLLAYGIRPDRVRLFANTIDVPAFGETCDRLEANQHELRESFGVGPEDVLVLSVGRLVPEKGYSTLIEAVAVAQSPSLALVIAGSGPLAPELEALARDLDVRLRLAGHLTTEKLAEAYVAADVFALLSEWEPWGVVVNEAAACGLPLVLSESVGAAADLLVDGENGILVRAGAVDAAARALERLATDGGLRESAGARSREIVRGWGYEPSVESFVKTVREAAGR
jgi:glycosyltransferase involved in cell wall biosynthesis